MDVTRKPCKLELRSTLTYLISGIWTKEIKALFRIVLYRSPGFRSIPISDYFPFQTADISIRYRLLQTYNKTCKSVRFCQN